MFVGSRIELSRTALKKNLSLIRDMIGEDTLLSSVIKGNAYGHGLAEMTGMLQAEGVKHFSVFNAEEAYIVHKFLQKGDRIMIMGDVEGDALAWAVENDIHFFVFDLVRLQQSLQLAEALGKPAYVHLEVETGMNRTGLNSQEFKQALHLIQQNPEYLKFEGLCTHFAGAESITNFNRVQGQIRIYSNSLDYCKKIGLLPRTRHVCCSAGVLRIPRMHLDMVRVGILQYGHWPSPETRIEYLTKEKQVEDPLLRILAWKTRVMTVKSVKAGDFIGYGTSFQASADLQIAVVPVGYGYGYSRSLSNQGYVIIKGRRAPVIGIVNMNALTVDVSEIPETQIGDEVILIGSSGEEEITVSSFAELSRQLNYEMLTRLPASIPRHIVN